MSDAVARTGVARWPFYYGWVNLNLAALALHLTAYAIVMGLAGGFVIVVFFTFWGKA
ncbi:MAG TPA: hypothetical protein VIC87_01685 [Vicinamibacteria bacterium]|jgi:hypothetical protein